MLGPEPIFVDRMVRLFGLTRAVEVHLKNIKPEDEVVLENYSAGINKVVENLVVYPPEFQITMNTFEPWELKDSIYLGHLMLQIMSTDWFGEFLRVRLLEVYDKSLVDELIPYKKEDF